MVLSRRNIRLRGFLGPASRRCIVTIAQNSITADDNIFSLYLALLDILEPQSVVNPEATPLSTSPPGSMDPGNNGG